MKKMLVMVMISGLTAISRGDERPVLRDREAPRATDLLRAQKLAEQAEKRLRIPARHSSGWKHGGSGWNTPESAHEKENVPVIIDMRPSRPARTVRGG
jgi:hypothetical protein